MDERLRRETEGLARSWMRHDERMLRDYLVADVEDPRINLQSILIRHFLVESLCGDRFAALMEQELRFGAVMNWLLKLRKKSGGPDEFAAILHALERGADNAEGEAMPHFVLQTFGALPSSANEFRVPHYLKDALSGRSSLTASQSPVSSSSQGGEAELSGFEISNSKSQLRKLFGEELLSTFQSIWGPALASEPRKGITVLEPACGSANDYRFLNEFGIARLIEYYGFDLCEKNVRNAKAMFPGTRFETGNIFKIDAEDKAFDLCFVQDLLEHFSIEAMEMAVAEICRVTRQALCIGFFSMHEEDDHVARPVEDYHWNTLSLARMIALFECQGFAVQPVHIGTFLRWRIGCEETHNENAYTLFGTAGER